MTFSHFSPARTKSFINVFTSAHNINQYAFYVHDAITAGDFLFNLGLRVERYDWRENSG